MFSMGLQRQSRASAHWQTTGATPPHPWQVDVSRPRGFAEFERELIKARTAEGRKRAQARGVRFGRKLKMSRHQILEAIARRRLGKRLAKSAGATCLAQHNLPAA